MNRKHFEIARRLVHNKRWKIYLTAAEGEVFEEICRDESAWHRFFQDPEKVLAESGKGQRTVRPSASNDSDSEPLPFAQVVAARIRTMIFEQLLPDLFPQVKDTCTAIIDSADLMQPLFPISIPSIVTTAPILSTRMIVDEDDDYDMPNTDATIVANGTAGSATPEPAAIEEEDSYEDLIPVDDMYFSVENDADAVEEYNKNQEKLLLEDYPSPAPSTPADVPTNETGPDVHESLKYLYQTIKKDVVPEKLDELRELLVQVRPSRSKWANPERVGQEQLYEALEMVLNELRAYTEHSRPFLEPVSKREVPTYYDVIKNPMDLKTMGVKLRNLEYNSKDEFASDLYLIWSNCMQFNVDPDSIYRKHATAMKRKTTDLLKKVPNITIVKVKGDDSDSDDEKEPRAGESLSRAVSVSEGDDHQMLEPVKMEVDEFNGVSDGLVVPAGSMGVDDVAESLRAPSADVPNGVDVRPPDEVADTQPGNDAENGLEDIVDEGSLQMRRWKGLTLKHRHDVWKWREEQSSVRFADRKALSRKGNQMDEFVEGNREMEHRNKRRRTILGSVSVGQSRPHLVEADQVHDEDEMLRASAFLPETMYPLGSFPALCTPGADSSVDPADQFLLSRWRNRCKEMPSLSDFQAIQTLEMGRLARTVHHNIQEHKRIRELHAKIIAYDNLQNEPGAPPQEPPPPPPPFQPYRATRDESTLPPLVMNNISAGNSLRHIATMHLAHAGFEAGNAIAIATLTDAAEQYFLNIGRTMRVYLDKFGKAFTPETILTHVLRENGIDAASHLDTFMRVDIQRHGAKLVDLRKKLDYAYKDMVRTRSDQEVADDDFQDEDAQEQIMSGNFFGDLGVDFLNLGELGLGFTNVPTEIWNRKSERPIRARVRRRLQQVEEEEETPIQPLERSGTLLPWRPIDPAGQIGLLKSFYERKVAEDDMVETEDKDKSKGPFKSKSLLRIATMGRKRAPGPGGGGDDAAKKKKKGPDPAVKAAKEAEKQKKQAEKAEKQRQMAEKKANKGKGKKAGPSDQA
ncbi:Transcriptional activator spt7 [Rhizophlyctis rosea]|nr:Transcriptional activator spt7 [Rhizophlyctis rosea]